jgi:hypothetical protein
MVQQGKYPNQLPTKSLQSLVVAEQISLEKIFAFSRREKNLRATNVPASAHHQLFTSPDFRMPRKTHPFNLQIALPQLRFSLVASSDEQELRQTG